MKSSIHEHVSRKKHQNNLAQFVAKGGDDGEVKKLLSEHFASHPNESGSRTSSDTHLYRYRTVETFFSSGTPLVRVDKFRPLLERAGFL